jgi:hypothetical protein
VGYEATAYVTDWNPHKHAIAFASFNADYPLYVFTAPPAPQ